MAGEGQGLGLLHPTGRNAKWRTAARRLSCPARNGSKTQGKKIVADAVAAMDQAAKPSPANQSQIGGCTGPGSHCKRMNGAFGTARLATIKVILLDHVAGRAGAFPARHIGFAWPKMCVAAVYLPTKFSARAGISPSTGSSCPIWIETSGHRSLHSRTGSASLRTSRMPTLIRTTEVQGFAARRATSLPGSTESRKLCQSRMLRSATRQSAKCRVASSRLRYRTRQNSPPMLQELQKPDRQWHCQGGI